MTALDNFKSQNRFMQSMFQDKIIKGENVATLVEQVIKIVEDNQLFERDVITGRIRSLKLSNEPEHLLTYEQAHNTFNTFFCDRVFVKDYKIVDDRMIPNGTKKVSAQLLETVWNQVLDVCTYNSRKEIFDAIPKWDGVPRIGTFMHDYFDCDTNPNFFWLFMTSIIGKMDDPAKNYVPYFFDFVGKAKGTGKSTLCEHLLGKYAVMQSMSTRSKDDFFVNCYNTNAIVVIDDECSWVSKDNCSPDEFKALVTARIDRFSRKFRQPEEHDRAFVIVRTSNEPNTVFSTNERRQIIFNIGLPENVCKHWDLPQEYMDQMLAEAKAYYLEHGMYVLTAKDKEDIYQQNLENYSTENSEYSQIEEFFNYVRDNLEQYTRQCKTAHAPKNCRWINWNDYNAWCLSEKRKAVDGRRFWRQVNAYAKYNKADTWYEDGKKHVQSDSATRQYLIGIVDKNMIQEDDLADVPF